MLLFVDEINSITVGTFFNQKKKESCLYLELGRRDRERERESKELKYIVKLVRFEGDLLFYIYIFLQLIFKGF